MPEPCIGVFWHASDISGDPDQPGAPVLIVYFANVPDPLQFPQIQYWRTGTSHRCLFQHAACFGRVGRDRIHQRRRQAIVGRKPELCQPGPDRPHIFRLCT